jgi:hypothetical protein
MLERRGNELTVAPTQSQIFLSYSGDDACEASLLQFALETLLAARGVRVWTYQRDQGSSTRSVNTSLKEQISVSRAAVFLASPSTIKGGAVQWMELAYADAFKIPTFVLLHRITFAKLKTKERGVPPFLVEGQCTRSTDWRHIVDDLRSCLPPT